MRSADEESAPVQVAECQVGNTVGNEDLSEKPAGRIDTMNTITGARPEIAVLVHADAVGITWRDLVENVAAPQPAVRQHIESANILLGIILGLLSGLANI